MAYRSLKGEISRHYPLFCRCTAEPLKWHKAAYFHFAPTVMSPSPLAAYRHALNQGFAYDGAQERAALALEQCFQALEQGETPQGLYLWGQVGRGKTWLMDNFITLWRPC